MPLGYGLLGILTEVAWVIFLATGAIIRTKAELGVLLGFFAGWSWVYNNSSKYTNLYF
jgi:hypothetical protein